MWIRIHDTLEENGIDTVLANPYKTKIIATDAKIKSDKLDALRYYLIYCELTRYTNHMYQNKKTETKEVW
ncbi:MAG: hypothetical protein AB7V56_11120 [Candidatus Nitrosocosmicus sp.]